MVRQTMWDRRRAERTRRIRIVGTFQGYKGLLVFSIPSLQRWDHHGPRVVDTGNDRVPGPTCSTRLGDNRIDNGTLCRAKSAPSANKGEKVKIDLHKQEQTNGCVFIVDDKTPAVGAQDLRTLEPALITKIFAAGGVDEAKLERSRLPWNDARSHYHAVIRIASPAPSAGVLQKRSSSSTRGAQ